MNLININGRDISQVSRPFFIADIAANHDGELNRAFKLIELAKESGADAAKFQNFKADKIVSRRGFDTMGDQLSHQANWKKSVFEIYEDASVNEDWTPQLKAKCDEVGIEYFTSPYDMHSVDAVDPYVALYKIGSGDITWLDIISYIAQKNKPVLIASGASSMADVDRAMEVILKYTNKIVLMQCNTNYTGSPDNFKFINLNVLKLFKEKYPQLILGLSDHTHGYSTVLGAQALGATVFEKHFTDDNNRAGPDHKFAMNPNTWREMVSASNELFQALGDGVKKIEENEKQTVLVQRRGLRYQRFMPKGHIVTEMDIYPLRPYKPDGFHPYQKDKIIGKILCKDVDSDQLVRPGDLSDD